MTTKRIIGPGTGTASGSRASTVVTAFVCALFGLAPISSVAGQGLLGPNESSGGFRDGYQTQSLERPVELDTPLVPTEGRYVVVHLAENRVFVMEGERAVWSAPAGTGNGFRLARGEHEWKFDTPKGLFKVMRKEKDPVWVAPDWWYVENQLPVPTGSQPRVRDPGTMGTSAVYLGDGLAIHGTNRPELLLNPDPEARRVSHGCIRLTNEAARALYHLVDVGTPVLIY